MKCPVFSDERLERLGKYFVYHRIYDRYGITFERFVRMVEAGTWGKEYSENDDEDIMECDICGTRFVGLSKPCPVCKSIMVSTAV